VSISAIAGAARSARGHTRFLAGARRVLRPREVGGRVLTAGGNGLKKRKQTVIDGVAPKSLLNALKKSTRLRRTEKRCYTVPHVVFIRTLRDPETWREQPIQLETEPLKIFRTETRTSCKRKT